MVSETSAKILDLAAYKKQLGWYIPCLVADSTQLESA